MPAGPKKKSADSSANLGFEQKLWLTADKLRNNMDAAEYKHVVLGLIFLKYISDTFEEHRAQLLAGQGDYAGANAEDPDEYKAENVFRVPAEARWSHLHASAKQPTIGKTVDDAMGAIERDNPRLEGVLPKDHARPGLDKQRLGELIDLIATIELTAAGEGEKPHRFVDLLDRAYEYFLTHFASVEGKNGGHSSGARTTAEGARRVSPAAHISSTPPPASSAASSRCSPRTRAASTTPPAAPAACSCSRKSSSNPTAASASTMRASVTLPHPGQSS